MEEPPPRPKRRRRRRRGGGGGSGAPIAAAPPQEAARGRRVPLVARRPQPDWRWRTFPVFFAFVLGAFLMGLATNVPDFAVVLPYVMLAAVSYGLAHMLVRWYASRRR